MKSSPEKLSDKISLSPAIVDPNPKKFVSYIIEKSRFDLPAHYQPIKSLGSSLFKKIKYRAWSIWRGMQSTKQKSK